MYAALLLVTLPPSLSLGTEYPTLPTLPYLTYIHAWLAGWLAGSPWVSTRQAEEGYFLILSSALTLPHAIVELTSFSSTLTLCVPPHLTSPRLDSPRALFSSLLLSSPLFARGLPSSSSIRHVVSFTHHLRGIANLISIHVATPPRVHINSSALLPRLISWPSG